jgi:hypothetical protein
LYAMNPLTNDSYSTTNKFQFVETVKENLGFLTPRQQERAKKARALYRALGTPSLDDLKAMIRMNLIKNNSVTTEDINSAARAFGPDVAMIKGKTTRTNPAPAVSNLVEIPDELLETHQDVTISMDGLTVNTLKFLSTISHNIYYGTAQYVSQPIASIYKKFLDEVFSTYKHGGFEITEVHTDNEFHKVMDSYSMTQDPPIHMNYAAAKAHVPRAERNNRTIQERVRATYHRLPYTHLPCILVKYLVTEAARKVIFFQINMVSQNTSAHGCFYIKKK